MPPPLAARPSPLDRALHLDALRWAWRRVRANKGGAGADGVTLHRFARLLDANLLALADEVRDGGYRPGAYHRVTIFEGGKPRRLAIPPVRDRVLQRAVLDVLMPSLDRRFLPCSFGYRPGRSLHDAVERIVRLRDSGLMWVLDADIRACFDRLDHGTLRSLVAAAVPDPEMRALLDTWIAGPPPRPNRPRPTRGLPQGAVISPLLANLYLHELDRGLTRRRYRLVRYADDFIVLCQSERHAERALRATERVLGGLKLELHPAKTRITSFEAGFDFLGVHFEGTDYTYVTDDKRIVIDTLPPEWFHYHAEGYDGRDRG